jgi:hypothetical protein
MIEFRRPGQALLENVPERGGPGSEHKQNQQQKTSIHFSPKATRFSIQNQLNWPPRFPALPWQSNVLQSFVSI